MILILLKKVELNRAEVLSYLDISQTILDRWHREGLPSKVKNGIYVYDLKELLTWFFAVEVPKKIEKAAKKEESRQAPTGSIEAEKLLKITAERQLLELDLLVKRGDLISVQKLKLQLTDVFAKCRSKLLAIPVKAAPLVSVESDFKKNAATLEDLIKEATDELVYNEQ